jgi:hypothetical protein
VDEKANTHKCGAVVRKEKEPTEEKEKSLYKNISVEEKNGNEKSCKYTRERSRLERQEKSILNNRILLYGDEGSQGGT